MRSIHTSLLRASLLCITFSLVAVLAPAVAAAAAPLVVIDPGHGGRYSNANANGLREKNVNLSIALELRRYLISRGYRVAMTRTTDRAVTYRDISTWNLGASGMWSYSMDGHTGIFRGLPKDDLQARVNIANKAGADLFISIHNNGSANRSARGTETYAAGRDRLGRSLAPFVHNRILKRTGLRNRGVHYVDYYVCRWSNMPAILVEGAFISNPNDARLLRQAWFRRRLALGIAEGVDAWFDAGRVTRATRRVVGSTASSAAVAASRSICSSGTPAVVVARADRWADVPGAPALAAKLKGSLLWVGGTGASAATLGELRRLAPRRLVLVGVDGSFDTTMTRTLAQASKLATSAVESIDGADRAAVAASIATSVGPSPSGHVFIVDDKDASSMLAAAPVAATKRIPILLASQGTVGEETAAFIAGSSSWLRSASLVGPTSTLPTSVARGVPAVRRLNGVDFAAKSGAVTGYYHRTTARGSIKLVVADRRYGAEYLTAAWYGARTGGRPVLPVEGRVLPTRSRVWLTNRRPQVGSFEVIDARRTIPPLMEHMLRKADYE